MSGCGSKVWRGKGGPCWRALVLQILALVAAFDLNFFFERKSFWHFARRTDTPNYYRNSYILTNTVATTAMDERENYSPGMIRMWRVFRTCKEMCLDRVW